MEFGTIIGTVILLGIALLAVLQPILANRRGDFTATLAQKKRDELLSSYERVLATIRDLDEDYNTGKLDDESYQAERAIWTERGIAVLQELEPQEEQIHLQAPRQSQAEQELNDAVENAIAAYRKAKA